MHYIEVKNLTYYYDETPVLQNVNFTIDPGEFVILTGENGAAKSTLLRNILGLLIPYAGETIIAQKTVTNQPLRIGYIPQDINSFNAGFPSTVLELVTSGRFQGGHWFKRLKPTDHQLVETELKKMGMWDFRNRRIGELSGGQKQRICLVRMFVGEPDLMILDEPTAGMDQASRQQLYALLQEKAHTEQKAILMVTHDHEDIMPFVDRHIELRRGQEEQVNV